MTKRVEGGGGSMWDRFNEAVDDAAESVGLGEGAEVEGGEEGAAVLTRGQRDELASMGHKARDTVDEWLQRGESGLEEAADRLREAGARGAQRLGEGLERAGQEAKEELVIELAQALSPDALDGFVEQGLRHEGGLVGLFREGALDTIDLVDGPAEFIHARRDKLAPVFEGAGALGQSMHGPDDMNKKIADALGPLGLAQQPMIMLGEALKEISRIPEGAAVIAEKQDDWRAALQLMDAEEIARRADTLEVGEELKGSFKGSADLYAAVGAGGSPRGGVQDHPRPEEP